VPPSSNQGDNVPHEQFVPRTQPPSFDQGQNLPHEQFVSLTQPSSCDVGENLPPSVICTQASISIKPITIQESHPPVPTHPLQ